MKGFFIILQFGIVWVDSCFSETPLPKSRLCYICDLFVFCAFTRISYADLKTYMERCHQEKGRQSVALMGI